MHNRLNKKRANLTVLRDKTTVQQHQTAMLTEVQNHCRKFYFKVTNVFDLYLLNNLQVTKLMGGIVVRPLLQ